MKKPFDKNTEEADTFTRLIGLGEKSLQKSYYPKLQQKIRELEESEHRYRLLAENVSDVIWLLDLNNRFQYISPSIEWMSGYASGELAGAPVEKILTETSAGVFSDTVAEAIEHYKASGASTPRKIELEQVCKDGSYLWIEVVASVFYHDIKQEKRILGVARDITERKRAEAEKAKIQEQLLQSQKMESIGTLTGGIAHDFNNLLTIINGYADVALMGLDKSHPQFKAVSAIRQAGERAESLTRQLLGFSRKQIFTPVVLDINRTIFSMEKMLRRLIGEDITIESLLTDGIDTVSADRSQIEQIFTNLVINARDALNTGKNQGGDKKITIETGQAEFDADGARRVNLELPGSYVFFSVSDNGIGMADNIRTRIFEPFFTTKAKHEGTGLGLSTVYGIVKQNKGCIQVYSEPDHGTMFKIYWPVSRHQAPKSKTEVPVLKDLSGNETVLVVEDDRDVCTFIANCLLSYGYRVHKAYNGEQALAFLRENTCHIDLIVTDLVMPGMGGQSFAQKLRSRFPDTKIIYISGYTDNHIVHNGLLKKGVNFIQKPFSQQQLAGTVRAVLDKKPD